LKLFFENVLAFYVLNETSNKICIFDVKNLDMSVITEKRIANSYFRFMKNWDNETKKELIIRLTKSIDEKAKNKFDFSSCFAAWQDERSADEIINELRSDRVNKKEIEEF
jgi:RAB protein geranylgeranyltransferase component A